MIKALQQYILKENGCQGAQNIILQNEQIKQEIQILQQKFNKVHFKHKNINANSDELEQIRSMLKKSESDLIQQRETLSEQSKQINSLIMFVEKYLQQDGAQPRALQTKIESLKLLINQASINNCPQKQLDKMRSWNKKMIETLQKKMIQLVSVFNTHIRLRLAEIQSYKDLLNESICRQFVRALYRSVLVYDVPSASYQLLVPGKETQAIGIVSVERESVVFTCDQAQGSYNYLLKAIEQTEKLALLICSSLGEDQKYCDVIRNQIKNSQSEFKAIIEYILPYLSLERRKKLMQLLTTKSQSQITLYDILASVRFKGQDGEMLESNVEQIVLKIKNQPNLVKEVQAFFQMCVYQQISLNVGLYMCNQLANRLEGLIQYEEIQKLLTLREQIRYKIHQI